MIEMLGYDSTGIIQVPLMRTLAFGGRRLPEQLSPMKGNDRACVDRWVVDAIQ